MASARRRFDQPRGATGLNFKPLLSNGSTGFTNGGAWFNTGTDYTIDSVKLFGGDFNGDGLSDVGLVSPRGATGLNFVPLLSNGSTGFTNGGAWFNTGTDYTIDSVKLFGGDFNGDGPQRRRSWRAPRGATGLNFVPLLSNGSTGLPTMVPGSTPAPTTRSSGRFSAVTSTVMASATVRSCQPSARRDGSELRPLLSNGRPDSPTVVPGSTPAPTTRSLGQAVRR